MTDNKMSVPDQYACVATFLGTDVSFVRQVAARLKADGLLPATRAVPAQLTALSLATLVFGLGAAIPSKAAAAVSSLSMLPRTEGDGAAYAETELEHLISQAAGCTESSIDFRAGDLLISADRAAMQVAIVKRDGTRMMRTYASKEAPHGMSRWTSISLPSIRKLAMEIVRP